MGIPYTLIYMSNEAISGDKPETITKENRINIPIEEKRNKMLEMSEKDFRNNIVRPLFLRLGYETPRETHGADELGKDIIFTERDKLGLKRLIAIQTKKGKINMAAQSTTNATNIVVQLRTALETSSNVPGAKFSKKPDEVILCSSGTINDRARDYINDELKDSPIRFLDSEDIIPLVDENCPDVWLGITSDILSYYDAIKKQVESFDPKDIIATQVTDKCYVRLKLVRVVTKHKKVRGQIKPIPVTDELDEKQILNNSEDIVVLSDAGKGKSTLLWRLAYLISRKPNPAKRIFPLIVKAKDFDVDSIKSIDNFISYCRLETQKLTQEINIDESTLEKGELLLMIDALDEISDENFRTEIIEFIFNTLKDKYPKIRILCTSRLIRDVEEHEKLKNPYRIESLSSHQARKILKRGIGKQRSISKSDEKSMLKHAQKILRRLKEVHGFELTPLLLTIFAYTAEYENRDIPANITELFKKFTELMLDRWDRERGFNQQYQYSLKDFLLRKIAYQMHEEGKTSISVDDFKKKMTGELTAQGYSTESDTLYQEITRSGLLKAEGNTISFRHHLLQEFFAGRGIKDITTVRDTQLKDSWWTKCFVFYFGEHPENAHDLQKLQKRNGSDSMTKNKAIGLSLQACFLSDEEIKTSIWCKLITSVENLIENLNLKSDLFPIHSFMYVNSYIKDALPLSLFRGKKVLEDIWPEWNKSEIRRFLIFTALIELDKYDLISKCQKKELQFNKNYLSAAFHYNVQEQVLAYGNKDAKELFKLIEHDNPAAFKEIWEETSKLIEHQEEKTSNE